MSATPKPRKRRKDRILDAAEQLFAAHGFDGVTLRAIATVAGVDVALANYHFGKKRDLFDAVLLRRADVLNKARQSALDECLAQAKGGRPTVEDIIHAYVDPMAQIHQNGDEGWRAYFALVAYVNNSPEWGQKLMTRFFNPIAHSFIEALKLALPDADIRDLFWSYHYLSGALTLTFADTGRIDQLSDGAAKSHDLAAAYSRMTPFIAAGIREICDGGRR